MSNHAHIYYTDGGCLKNGDGGFGTYCITIDLDDKLPKKDGGLHAYGYEAKAKDHKLVKLEDNLKSNRDTYKIVATKKIWGGIANTTNNVGEMSAFMHALIDSKAHVAKGEPVMINSDSQYVLNTASKYMHTWVKLNWIRERDGVPPANVDLWKEIYALYGNGKGLSLGWVRGHSEILGNEIADSLATKGISLIQRNDPEVKTEQVDLIVKEEAIEKKVKAKKKKADFHKMLTNNSLYFMSDRKVEETKDGRFIYYMGNHADSDSKIRIDNPDAHVSVTLQTVRDPVIQFVVDQYNDKSDTIEYPKLVIGKLAKMNSPKVYPIIRDDGPEETYRLEDRDSFSLLTLTDEELARVEHAPRVSYKYLDRLEQLKRILGQVADAGFEDTLGEDRLFDVTDQFYSGEGKNRTVLDSITSATKIMKVKADLRFDPGITIRSGVKKDGELALLPMTFGLDIPPLNMFKAVRSPTCKAFLHAELLSRREGVMGRESRTYQMSFIIMETDAKGNLIIWSTPSRTKFFLQYGI